MLVLRYRVPSLGCLLSDRARLLRRPSFGRLFGKSALLYGVDLEEMVNDNENHGDGAEKDG